MNEGRELLVNIINNKLDSIKSLENESVIVNDVNVVNLYHEIMIDDDNIYKVTDEIIEYVCANDPSFKESITKVRDLLVGKKEYNLNVQINEEYLSIIEIFKSLLFETIDASVPGLATAEETKNRLNSLLEKIKNRELINDYELIENIVKDYKPTSYDDNMLQIMLFINNNNLSIMKVDVKEPDYKVYSYNKNIVNESILEILDKLNIIYDDLPHYVKSELKNTDVDNFKDNYSLVRKNKVEDYGVLHLINKNNTLARLALLLYATPDSIKAVVDSVKDSKGIVDIRLMKTIMQFILPAILIKENEFAYPKCKEFLSNMKLLKSLGVNYRTLIIKNPLFMLTNNDILNYNLNYVEDYGANKKTIINKCYKTLSLYPSLIIENMNVLKNHNIDLIDYFSPNNNNYNLLKVRNLDKKINYLSELYKDKIDFNNYKELTKLVIDHIYESASLNSNLWGDKHD